MSSHPPSPARYDGVTILFHWLTALLVAYQWFGAQVFGWLARGPLRSGLWSSHFFVGALLALIVLARLGWRATRGRRLAKDPGALGVAARGMHHGIYLMLVVILGLGLFLAWVRGSSLAFGHLTLPVFDPSNPTLRRTVLGWHELAANVLIALAGLHALAALGHHYALRDRMLERMGWPARRA